MRGILGLIPILSLWSLYVLCVAFSHNPDIHVRLAHSFEVSTGVWVCVCVLICLFIPAL